MRLVALLAILMAAMMAEHGFADDKPDTRTYWVYEGGWFAKSDDGSWYELNETTFRKLGKPVKFGEAKRSKDFIDLYDDSRKIYVRLWEDHAETLSRKGDWEKLYTGRWKTPE